MVRPSPQRGYAAPVKSKAQKGLMTDTTTTTDEDTSGLKAKNAELLGKLKTANAAVTDLTSRLTALEEDRDAAIDTTKSDADKALAKIQRQLDKATADLAARDTQLGKLLIDNSINEAIASNNVLPHFAPAVRAMLTAGAKIENGEAFAADGSPLSEATVAFFKSADAKHYVAAPANTGAGAAGNTGKAVMPSKKPETAEEWEAYMKMTVDNPVEASAFAAKHGI